MSLQILMLAWEYPPDHVGGLGRHVCHLARAMTGKGARVTVLTRGVPGQPPERDDSGVTVISAQPYGLHPPDFVTWAAEFNVSLLETCNRLFSRGDFDLVHAHDWIVAYAARALKHSWEVPLIATVHATEFGRQKGLHTPMQHHISETEWWLCYEAWKVITCSRYMKDEVLRVFSVPGDKVEVIPNGISDSWFEVPRRPDPEPLVIYVGRLVPEKGPHILVEAMSDILIDFPTARLVLAGSGPMEGDLKKMIYERGLGKVVDMPGHLDDGALKDLYSRSWVACFPSSYEPFGIVALEAMATGVPCVVGDAGGLREIVEDKVTGLVVPPEDPGALARAVKLLLGDRLLGGYLSENAKRVVRERFSWPDIAGRTLQVYEEVLNTRELVRLREERPPLVSRKTLFRPPTQDRIFTSRVLRGEEKAEKSVVEEKAAAGSGDFLQEGSAQGAGGDRIFFDR
ncbi:MAG TPA: glycosyltransferase family 4 protein [Firmicutes bacterium]|nr:glycosyltransferase family 4 protein [Candidatus Fermentithermobacillaceae bacterium]